MATWTKADADYEPLTISDMCRAGNPPLTLELMLPNMPGPLKEKIFENAATFEVQFKHYLAHSAFAASYQCPAAAPQFEEPLDLPGEQAAAMAPYFTTQLQLICQSQWRRRRPAAGVAAGNSRECAVFKARVLRSSNKVLPNQ